MEGTDHKDLMCCNKEFGCCPGAEGKHGIVLNRNLALGFTFQKCISSKIIIPYAHVVMFSYDFRSLSFLYSHIV